MYAALKGYTDEVKTLIAAKANLNPQDADGNSALSLAKTPAIAALLKDAGETK